MKVFAISDLHLSISNPKPMDIFGGAWDNYIECIVSDWNNRVNNDDIVLIAGDISWAMTLENAKSDLDFICALKGHKVLIRGNHDYWWKSISSVRSALYGNAYAVQNDCIRIGDYLIAGSRGWTTPERAFSSKDDEKIYSREKIRMELSLQNLEKMRAPNDKTIALIHYPPFNSRCENSPFTDLFTKYKIDKVVYGHLHGKDCRFIPKIEKNGTEYILSSCDLLKNILAEIY